MKDIKESKSVLEWMDEWILNTKKAILTSPTHKVLRQHTIGNLDIFQRATMVQERKLELAKIIEESIKDLLGSEKTPPALQIDMSTSSVKSKKKKRDTSTPPNIWSYNFRKSISTRNWLEESNQPSKARRKIRRRNILCRWYWPDRRRCPRRSMHCVSLGKRKHRSMVTCRFFSEAVEAPLLALPKSDDIWRGESITR